MPFLDRVLENYDGPPASYSWDPGLFHKQGQIFSWFYFKDPPTFCKILGSFLYIK